MFGHAVKRYVTGDLNVEYGIPHLAFDSCALESDVRIFSRFENDLFQLFLNDRLLLRE